MVWCRWRRRRNAGQAATGVVLDGLGLAAAGEAARQGTAVAVDPAGRGAERGAAGLVEQHRAAAARSSRL